MDASWEGSAAQRMAGPLRKKHSGGWRPGSVGAVSPGLSREAGSWWWIAQFGMKKKAFYGTAATGTGDCKSCVVFVLLLRIEEKPVRSCRVFHRWVDRSVPAHHFTEERWSMGRSAAAEADQVSGNKRGAEVGKQKRLLATKLSSCFLLSDNEQKGPHDVISGKY